MTAIFAHRGAHLQQRENTLEAFRDAVALGVAGVELDVRQTLDGALVVHHDPRIGDLAIGLCRAEDLPSYVPSLEAALDVLRGLTVNVEIKNLKDPREPTYDESGDFARRVIDVLHEHDWASSVIISSFDLTTCAQVRSYDIDIVVGWLIWQIPLASALTEAHVLGLDAVNPHFTLVTPKTVELATDLALDVNVWTVNEPEDIRAMAAMGVSSIITDQPALAMQLLAH